MNTLSDEEFEQIYGRKPVRRVKKKKIYWNRIIIALIILIGIVTGLVKLTALVVSKIKGDDTQKTNKVLNNTSSVAVKEDASSAEDKKDEPAKYSNMDFTVCVDAGHGDYDGGTTDASGKRYEKDDNLKVALEVQKYLEKYGVNVVMTLSLSLTKDVQRQITPRLICMFHFTGTAMTVIFRALRSG